ncbi:glycosyltransferase family 2 protein [Hydrogenophaga sp. RWCD_12]|uniref:glycosyltransferase family 2 protein n=1 Tax=Hydrogenophaga sp. RWCD_12 TaxID=3391190 RepID=UPI003984991C
MTDPFWRVKAKGQVRRRLDQVRRRVEQSVDQAAALAHRGLFGTASVPPFDGQPRFALVTVNYSTTRWLKLMLLTLSEQDALDTVSDIVVVDNDSRDGADRLRAALGSRVPRLRWVQNRRFLSHARGIRLGLRALDDMGSRANVVLAIDTDVVFLRQDTLQTLGGLFQQGAALAGEMRDWVYAVPEAQASFVAFRRDVYARRDIAPWVNHGAPSYWMQKSIRRRGLPVVDFATYRDGYALHRGRSGVLAAGRYRQGSSYASVLNHDPHFMGVPGGEETWRATEQRWGRYLEPGAEEALVELLARRLGGPT